MVYILIKKVTFTFQGKSIKIFRSDFGMAKG